MKSHRVINSPYDFKQDTKLFYLKSIFIKPTQHQLNNNEQGSTHSNNLLQPLKQSDRLPFTSQAYLSHKIRSPSTQMERAILRREMEIVQQKEDPQQILFDKLEKEVDEDFSRTRQMFFSEVNQIKQYYGSGSKLPVKEKMEQEKEQRLICKNEVEDLNRWKNFKQLGSQTARIKSQKIKVDPKFINKVQQKAEDFLTQQQETLLRSKAIIQDDIIRAPSKQLQAIMKQKAQKKELDFADPETTSSDKVNDVLLMKKINTTNLNLHQAQKMRKKLQTGMSAQDVSATNQSNTPKDQRRASVIIQNEELPTIGNRSMSSSSLSQITTSRRKAILPGHSQFRNLNTNSIQKLLVSKPLTSVMENPTFQESQSVFNNVNESPRKRQIVQRTSTIDTMLTTEEEDANIYDPYRNFKKVQQRHTFFSYLNGDQMRDVLKEINDEISKNLNETYIVRPLRKDLHIKLREISINYEIALELKAKQLSEMSAEKKIDLESKTQKKNQLEEEIFKFQNVKLYNFNNLQIIKHHQSEINKVQDISKASVYSQRTPLMKKPSLEESTLTSNIQFSFKHTINSEIDKQISLKRIIIEHEAKIQETDIKIQELQVQLKFSERQLKKVLHEVNYLEKEIRNIKKQQIDHYHDLLQLGLDPRQEGLIWIIKSIWLLGESVNLVNMPKWLDLKSCEFILDVITINIIYPFLQCARMQMQVQKLLQSVKNKQNHNKLARKQTNNLEPTSPRTQYKNEMQQSLVNPLTRIDVSLKHQQKQSQFLNRVRDKLKWMSQTTNRQINIDQSDPLYQQNQFFLSLLDDDFINKDDRYESEILQESNLKNQLTSIDIKVQKNGRDKIVNIMDLENEIKIIKQQIKEMRENELSRILKEFLTNNYERNHKVSLDVVIQALVGDLKHQKVMQKLNLKTEMMRKSIEQTKTFKFSTLRSNLSQLLLLDPTLKIV